MTPSTPCAAPETDGRALGPGEAPLPLPAPGERGYMPAHVAAELRRLLAQALVEDLAGNKAPSADYGEGTEPDAIPERGDR
jgi:hypothetical protein